MIGDLTFSEQPGFMRGGKDVANMLAINHAALDYVSAVSSLTMELHPACMC